MRLTNKMVLISGGASGIGRSIAEVFLGEEASVVISNIRRTALNDRRTVTVDEGYCATKASK